MFAYCSVAKYN